jgi:hypothetical protein
MASCLVEAALCLRRPALMALMMTAVTCAHGEDGSPEDQPARGKEGGAATAGNGGSEVGSGGDGSGGGAFDSGSSGVGGDGGGSGSELAAGGAGAGGDNADAGTDVGGGTRDASDASDGKSTAEAGLPVRPTGITVSAQITLTQFEIPSTGGIPFNDACPQNQVLIGFKGTVATIDGGQSPIRSVQGVCAPLSVTTTTPYQVKVGAGTSLPLRNVASTVPVVAMCPTDQVLVGFGGRYSQYVDGLDFRCAPLVISGASPTYTLSIGGKTTTSTIGAASGGTTFTAIFCPNNQVGVAQDPHAGSAIDAFAIACATPSLVVQ